MLPTETPVLIVGAGPTGLVLALWLAKCGVDVTIIEKKKGPGEASRAMAIQARTLEYYRQLGIHERIIDAGFQMDRVHVRQHGRELASIRFDEIGEPLSAFSFALSLPQDIHERLLVEALAQEGVSIVWESELKTFEPLAEGVRTLVHHEGKEVELLCSFLCGCDGAHSTVREGSGISFPGGTYEDNFFVADVTAEGEVVNGKINLCFEDDHFCAVFPVRNATSVRLVGIVPRFLNSRDEVQFEDLQPTLKKITTLKLEEANWFSVYSVHHRVADAFRKNHVFILGDAGHVHSPAGGQGMNTGIGDAVNLAWKLAAVLKKEMPAVVLDSYEPERITFAKLLVNTTDQGFSMFVKRNFLGKLVRSFLLPFAFPRITRLRAVRRAMFETISQIRIQYRNSLLSKGTHDGAKPGDRMPWVKELDNYAALKEIGLDRSGFWAN